MKPQTRTQQNVIDMLPRLGVHAVHREWRAILDLLVTPKSCVLNRLKAARLILDTERTTNDKVERLLQEMEEAS